MRRAADIPSVWISLGQFTDTGGNAASLDYDATNIHVFKGGDVIVVLRAEDGKKVGYYVAVISCTSHIYSLRKLLLVAGKVQPAASGFDGPISANNAGAALAAVFCAVT